MGKITNPLIKKNGETIKPMSMKEILGEKKDIFNKLYGEKNDK